MSAPAQPVDRCEYSNESRLASWTVDPPSSSDVAANEEFLSAVRSGDLNDVLAHTRYMETMLTAKLQAFRESGKTDAIVKDSQLKKLPRSFQLFDWIVGVETKGDTFKVFNPKSVFIRGSFCRVGAVRPDLAGRNATLKALERMIEICTERAEVWGHGLPDTIAAIGDCDTHLSTDITLVRELQAACGFKHVYYEALDVEPPPWLSVLPIGLTNYYVSMAGHEVVRKVIVDASLEKKSVMAMSSFNYIWDHFRQVRDSLSEFLQKTCWIRSGSMKPDEYWANLANSRFFLSPEGDGVQTPKIIEALLVLTIPIVSTKAVAWRQLKEAGFPLVLVNEWIDVTPENLERWYQELSPKLLAFRGRLLAERRHAELLDVPEPEVPAADKCEAGALEQDLEIPQPDSASDARFLERLSSPLEDSIVVGIDPSPKLGGPRLPGHIPTYVRSFDWIFGPDGQIIKREEKAETIFIAGPHCADDERVATSENEANNALQKMVWLCKELQQKFPQTVAVVSNCEERLGRGNMRKWLDSLWEHCRFRHILFDAKDVEQYAIGTAPIVLTRSHIAIAGEERVMHAIRNAKLDAKPLMMMAGVPENCQKRNGNEEIFKDISKINSALCDYVAGGAAAQHCWWRQWCTGVTHAGA
jgi:hypothetical protein